MEAKMKERVERENFRTIHLSEVKQMLGITGKGFRTVIDWCKQKDIAILGSGKRKRILETDWNYYQQLAFVEAVQFKHPDWEYLLKEKGIRLERLQGNIRSTASYQGQTDVSQKFLKDC